MATDQQILDEAKASLLRILQADTSDWSEESRRQHFLSIKDLRETIAMYENRVAAGSRRIVQPIRRVNF